MGVALFVEITSESTCIHYRKVAIDHVFLLLSFHNGESVQHQEGNVFGEKIPNSWLTTFSCEKVWHINEKLSRAPEKKYFAAEKEAH